MKPFNYAFCEMSWLGLGRQRGPSFSAIEGEKYLGARSRPKK